LVKNDSDTKEVLNIKNPNLINVFEKVEYYYESLKIVLDW